MAKTYSDNYKKNVVRIAQMDEFPLSTVARSFGINMTTMKKWLKEAEKVPEIIPDDSNIISFHKDEIRDLLFMINYYPELLETINYQKQENLRLQNSHDGIQSNVLLEAIGFFGPIPEITSDSLPQFIHLYRDDYGIENILEILYQVPDAEKAINQYRKTILRHEILRESLDDSPVLSSVSDNEIPDLPGIFPEKLIRELSQKCKPAKVEFLPNYPLQLWVVDLIEVKIDRKKYYAFFISDPDSRKIVSYYMGNRLPKKFPIELVESAIESYKDRYNFFLDMIIDESNNPINDGLHLVYTAALEKKKIAPEFGHKAGRTITARAKGLLASFSVEFVDDYHIWGNQTDPILALDYWVHWFNNKRIHSGISYKTPTKYEEERI